MAAEYENNLGMEFLKSARAVTSCPGSGITPRKQWIVDTVYCRGYVCIVRRIFMISIYI